MQSSAQSTVQSTESHTVHIADLLASEYEFAWLDLECVEVWQFRFGFRSVQIFPQRAVCLFNLFHLGEIAHCVQVQLLCYLNGGLSDGEYIFDDLGGLGVALAVGDLAELFTAEPVACLLPGLSDEVVQLVDLRELHIIFLFQWLWLCPISPIFSGLWMPSIPNGDITRNLIESQNINYMLKRRR